MWKFLERQAWSVNLQAVILLKVYVTHEDVWIWLFLCETGSKRMKQADVKSVEKRKYKNDNSVVVISHYIIECWKTFSTLKKLRTKLILIIATEGVFFGKRENISSLLYQDRSTCLRIVFPQHFSVPKFRPGQ